VEFIFMLTSDDRTVDDALAIYRGLAGGRLRLAGFKDVGATADTLRALTDAMHNDGRPAFLEVVSTSRDDELRSIETGLAIGVDYLLGGTHVEDALPLLRGEKVRYFPFPGTVVGHPSELRGSIDEIASHAAEMTSSDGVHGLDLLAYRNRGVDPAGLVAAVVAATPAPVIVAGSIQSEARIGAVAKAGAWAFTIGQAIFTGRLPGAPSIAAQVDWVLDVAERATATG
jgi:hypothetical protein